MAPSPVVLVATPWTTLRAPSIQIGTVKAVLDRAGVAAETAHLYVPFYEYIQQCLVDPFKDVDDFEQWGWLLGEWTFAVPPFRTPSELRDERFRLEFGYQFGEQAVDRAFAVRRLVPAFLDMCADELLAHQPVVVGFSTTFAQTVPSLVLAKILKQRRPDLKVVMGGSNCEGPMGAAMHKLYPWLDVVVRGEAERVAPRLFTELVAGEALTGQPGLCIRDGGRRDVVPESRSRAAMQEVPLPQYEEYFDRLRRSRLSQHRIWLPYETSRGCWWGVKHLCTFCAANGESVTFRSKPANQVVEDLDELPRRYGVDHIWFVDNIIDERYLHTVFPTLAKQPTRPSIFVETKAHMAKRNITMLADAGVVMAQIGIESLSTPILKLMDKGTTALQNIRILKWSAEVGIKAFWNLIYGFPGESPEEYQRMADLVPSLLHLEAPNPPVRLRLDRFSPYHDNPAKYGIKITGPLPVNRYVYAGDPGDVLDLQYFFTFSYLDERDPDTYVRPLVAACDGWRRNRNKTFGSLCYERVGDQLRIVDRRCTDADQEYLLSPTETQIYLACDGGSTIRRLAEHVDGLHDDADLRKDLAAFLAGMVQRRLMYRENDTYLSLALCANRSAWPQLESEERLDALADARSTGRSELHVV
jgi:ribosomal peptide maturation radical SAM protein 1